MSVVDDTVSATSTADDRSTMSAVRPKLKLDTVFIESPDGTYFRGPAKSFFVKGASAYKWISALRPYLTGEHTLAELCDGLGPDQTSTVVELVRTLIDRGAARDCATDTPSEHGLADEVLARFADQINFVDHMADGDGPARFAGYRTTQVLLVGSGEALLGAADGLLRNGLASLTVAPSDGARPYVALLTDTAGRLAPVEPELRVLAPGAALSTGDFDVVVYSGDTADPHTAADLNERCVRSGTVLIPVVAVGDKVVLGPTAGVDGKPCWHCALLRLTANVPAVDAAAVWRDLALGGHTERRIHSVNAARMVGGAAAFEVFRRRCGLDTDTDGAIVVQDAETLESARERLLAHPACPVCPPSGRTEADPDVTGLDVEQLYQRAGTLVGRHAGIVGEYADDPLEQIPLKIARVRLGTVGGAPARELTAFDVDNVLTARVAVLRRAAACYAGRLPGPHPGVREGTAAELAAAGFRVAVPTELSTGSAGWAPVDRLRWIGARALDAGEEVLVPLAAAYPFSTANDDLVVERAAAGSGSGIGRAAAILDGLCNALGYEALRAACAGHAPVRQVTEDELAATVQLAFMAKSLLHFGQNPRVFELPGAHPAHAAVAVTDGPDGSAAYAVGTGASMVDAVGAALRDALGRVQAEHFDDGTPDLGDPLFADLDPGLDFRRTDEPGGVPSASTETTAVVDTLAATGRRVLFVDTTPPDVASSEAIVTGTVLLWTPAGDGN